MKTPRILIVEDEIIIAKDIQTTLVNMGYAVCSIVSSGEEAIARTEKEQPDLVLMDINLKGRMDGIEAAEHIRSRFGTPLIFLTAFSDDEKLKRAKLTLPFGYILKPFQDKELKIFIEMALYAHQIDGERKRAERLVVRAKQEWERTFDSVPDLIAILDRKHQILRVNKAMAERLGVTTKEAVGLTCYEHVHGTSEPPEYCPHSRLLVDGQEHFAEIHEDRIGGDFLVTVSPLHDDDGHLTGSVHVARDITQVKMAQEALRKSEDKFRSLVEATSDWIWEVDERGIYTYSSPKVRELIGYKPEEILGKTPFDLMPQDEAVRVGGLFRDIIDSRESFDGLENINLHKGGQHVVLETSGVPILNADGNLVGYRGVDRDVTERKRAEEMFRAIFEQAAVGVALTSTQTGKLIQINQKYCDIVGYSVNDLKRISFQKITYPDDLQADLDKMEELKAGKINDFTMEKRYLRPDGSIVWVNLTVYCLFNSNKQKAHHIAIIEDITKRKAMEAEVKILSGLLPICASCKKIRDDKGYWNQIESYIHRHSNAQFSHGICPECLDKMYGGQDWYQKRRNK